MSLSVQETRRRFDEYATLEYLLTGDLRAALDDAPCEETRRWLGGVVASLIESLPHKLEITLELDAVLVSSGGDESQRPLFGDLHAVQRELLASLEEVHRLIVEVEGVGPSSKAPPAAASGTSPEADGDVSRRLHEWLEELADHNRSLVEAARMLLEPADANPRRRRKTR